MRVLALSALILAVAPPAARAQSGEPVTYTVSRNGAEIGQEVSTLKPGEARNPGGSTLVISARYPGSPRDSALDAMLARDRDRQLVLFQLDVKDEGGGSTILAAGSGARLLLRTDTPGSRAVREVPARGTVVLLDDHLIALQQAVADLATPGGTPITAIYPRTGRRMQFVARTEGDAGTRRRITLSGQLSGTLHVNANGRLVGVELPASGLTATAR